MKALLWLNITIGGFVGGYVGTLLDHGNGFGAWSIILSIVGSLVAIWLTLRYSD
jgi:uncharacterized membrane protein YeaQ/YmgE (transglycosylase-associated protein family)